MKDHDRCAVCGVALAEPPEVGCERGNCLLRPAPSPFYDFDRAEEEYGISFDKKYRLLCCQTCLQDTCICQPKVTCKARSANMGANDPQDCNWPFCNCDPQAEKVLSALQECGATFEDGKHVGFEEGVKSVTSVRCFKHTLIPQLNTDAAGAECPICQLEKSKRRRLPDERRGINHHFVIGGEHDGYVNVGLYEDGTPGEIFVKMSKQGSTISGLLDCWAITMSLAIQYGVPLQALCSKLAYTSFEPSGNTPTPLHYAKSVVDYIVRWMGMRFLKETGSEEEKSKPAEEM